MFILSKNKIIETNFFYLFVLCIFSFFINFYYSKLGSFPIDTFLHYDSAYRILKGELPIKDYWVVSGLTVDFVQSFFFKILGVNWFAYSVHACILNSIITIIIFYFFLSLKIKRFIAFILSLSFATLSYTISGTPFVDLHATFLLLIATIIIIQNLNRNFILTWSTVTILFFLSFFSKQVPVAYAVVGYFFILSFYFIKNKNYKSIYTVISTTFIIFAFLVLLSKLTGISYKSFYIQYIDYPRSIGYSRLFEISFNDFFNKFKFIIISVFLLTFCKFKKIKSKNLEFISDEFFGYLIFLIFTITLLFHQIMSKNQIYIYFLIPILFGFIESEINQSKIYYKKYLSLLLILTIIFITAKYHLRYNENRKFHELTKIQLNQTQEAKQIHKSLNGLKWKNPSFSGSSSKEILTLNKALRILDTNFKEEIMVYTHYLFLDSVTEKNLNYPSKTFTNDGASVPLLGNKYHDYYKKYLIKKIKEKKVNTILFLKHEKISQNIISNYIKENCYSINEDEIFYILKIKCLN